MNDRWDRVTELYHGALACAPEDRAEFLERMCPDDRALRQEVETLLEYDAKSVNFLERPVFAAYRADDLTRAVAPLPERIGPYETGVRLGAGGMGEVYLATDVRLNRRVALKLLLPEVSTLADSRARFLREARSSAALNHPNIATVFDAGEANGRLYLAMEYIDGKSLRSRLNDGPQSEGEVIEFGIQLASALDHAHSRGILHRDIKPENVMVDSAGATKLVDFSIAKTLSADPAETEAEAEITTQGIFVGTLRYAAPEVLSGQPASRQSDLYSLGVTLFELACGRTPFDGLAGLGPVVAILHGERQAVRDVNASVSEGLAETIERSIARTPEERFSSAAEMMAALQSIRDSGGAPAAGRLEMAHVPSFAITEFINVSRDPSLDWWGVGIVETIEGELRRVSGLQVASRARVSQVIRGLRLNVEEPAALVTLGRRLGANWIATGSFQRAGNRVRVLMSVVRTATGEVVPTEKVDGAWEDLFEVQDRVVASLKKALRVEAVPTSEPLRPAVPSLDAYEHYANGRRCLNEMGRDSLVQAKQHFEKAIAMNPKYALAYSGLGTAHALAFIQSSNRDDLRQARGQLERALELDSELGEPYPWLCNIYCRMGEVEKCLATGEKGVVLQPDLSLAHYFYAGCLIVAVEAGVGNYQKGIDGLTQALILEPQMGVQWMVAGFGALLVGQYGAAQWFFEGAARLEKTPNPRYRFVGASTMLGFLQARQLAWDEARQFHQESIAAMRSSEHVYRDTFTTLSACGLGEIELRNGQSELALTHFRHAWRIVQEQPRMIGNVRLGIRAQTGMAAAYAGTGDAEKSERHVAEAISRMGSLNIGSWIWDTLLCQLHYSIAGAQLRLGLTTDAINSLSRSIDTGFADAGWLEADPEWRSLRERSDFRQLIERVRLIPPVTIDLSRVPLPDTASSSAGIVQPS